MIKREDKLKNLLSGVKQSRKKVGPEEINIS
jgi:hypothetical protein